VEVTHQQLKHTYDYHLTLIIHYNFKITKSGKGKKKKKNHHPPTHCRLPPTITNNNTMVPNPQPQGRRPLGFTTVTAGGVKSVN
jgi:hypothetical protein